MDLTVKEKKWVERVQKALNACPSKRIGFYTIGDNDVMLYDKDKEEEVWEHLNSVKNSDWCKSVDALDAGFEATLIFPNPVESTAG